MYSGIVKKFNASEQYGFIVHNGQDIFFHMSFGGIMSSLGGEEPQYIKEYPGRMPKEGDTVVFDYDEGLKGLRATRWAFASSLHTAQGEIAKRRKFKLIERKGRVKVSRFYNDTDAKYHVLWEGTNVDELRSMYPLDRFPLFDHMYGALYFKIWSHEQQAYIDYEGDPRNASNNS